MKKVFITISILLISVSSVVSQKDPNKKWTFGGTGSLNVSQSTFVNWVAGGENSIGGTAFLNLYSNYKDERNIWDNTLDLGFGMMKQGKKPVFKTDDKIDFSSKYGRSITHRGKWYYSAILGFKTQFYEGKKSAEDTTLTSNFMAPAYLSLALGIDYKPKDNVSIFISPLTGRVTFVLDTLLSNLGAFGVTPGQNMRFEAGGFIKIQYTQPIGKQFTYTTKLELFSNYLEKPQNVDVNWENVLNFKFNSWLSANLYLTLLYDDDSKITITNDDGTSYQSSRLQVREIFGLGLTYKF